MAENCKIYTPDNCVSIILDEVGYTDNLYGKRVLENSCGTGNILRRIVERYILDAKSNRYTLEQIKEGLEQDITGLEIDSFARQKCKKRLSYIAKKYGITGVKWNVLNVDALTYVESDYSFVIGNPPYITYHDLSVDVRDSVRASFITCKKGRFDYCYAFVEQAVKNLRDGGKLAYILPNSILKNVWAEDLRSFIYPYIKKIIDFKNQNIFEDVTLSPIILIAEKSKNAMSSEVVYKCKEDNISISIAKSDLPSSGWALGNYTATSKLRFGDYFTVANSIATLLNEAFVIIDYEAVDNQYIKAKGALIERSVLRPAISIKSSGKQNRPLIIFPYEYTEQGLSHYSEEYFKKTYPCAYKYLSDYKEKLLKRTADKSAKWFEYGRSQAISHLNCEKLVMSTIISGEVKIEHADKYGVPYAGLYIVCTGKLSLKKAEEILLTDDFMNYIKQYGVPTTENSYRISKKVIEEYMFEQ